MSMTSRGPTPLGGARAVTSPFMDNGQANRIPITVDNKYNRGRIPPFSLWAPSDISNRPYLYMPYIPAIPLRDVTSGTAADIDNEWYDYFRVGDEVLALDISVMPGDLVFLGDTSDDETNAVLGVNTVEITAKTAKDGGTNGTGYVGLTFDAFNGTPQEGVLGTGDVLVLAGHSDSLISAAYQSADLVVIMEQEFNFSDARSGIAGEGGYLTESAVYSYTGRIDYNYINYYAALNRLDTNPAIKAGASNTLPYTSERLDFVNIYRA